VSRVTELCHTRGRRTWVDVVVDGETICSLPEQSVLQFGVRVGDRLHPATIMDLVEEAAFREALRTALRYLERRARTQVEIERRLRRDRTPPLAVERVVVRLSDLGYLDDQAFAASFARDRVRLRPCAPRHMCRELAARGVADAAARAGVEAALAELGETASSLLEQAARHQAARVNKGDPVGRRRLFGRLQRRGFNREEIVRWMGDEWPTDTTGR